jgi:hypothetical protein
VVSTGAQTPGLLGFQHPETTPPSIPTTPRTAPAVKRAIFTHCGSQIVGGDERVLGPLARHLGRERGIEARIAHDGMEFSFNEPNL